MSILTKVFVVLVAFLSVLLVALIVPFVAKTESFKEQVTKLNLEVTRANTAAKAAQAELSNLSIKEANRITELTTAKAALESEVVRRLEDLAEATTLVQAEKAKNEAHVAELTSLIAQSEQLTQILQSNEAELDRRRKAMIEDRTKMIQIVDQIDRKTVEVESLTRAVRRLREEKQLLDNRNRELEVAFSQLDPDVRDAVLKKDGEIIEPQPSPFKIVGTITNILNFEDDTLVEVDVGKNDGVTPNTRFYIHDNNFQYLGSLVITRVDVSASAARILNTKAGVQIEKGNSVYSGPFTGGS